MKSDKISIKWKLFGYLSLLVAVMLVLLWFSQIFFLASFYRTIKRQNIVMNAESLARNVDSEELNTLIDQIALREGMYIRLTDPEGNEIHTADYMPDSRLRMLRPDEIVGYYQKALSKGGTAFELSERDEFRNKPFDPSRFIGKVPPHDLGIMQSMVYVKIAQKSDGSSVVILLNTMITPVNATVDTLRIQLSFVSVILLGLSVVLALYISKKISKPIIKMNESAKKLAKGQYEVAFEGKGYLEIAELSKTLNFAAKELSKVEGLRRELIANISHDLRTPLTMIAGYAEVMRDLPGENTPKNVQIIIDEAKRLTTLVNDVLDISKLQSGVVELTPSEFCLTESIRDIMKRYTKLTEQDGYKIRFIANADATVFADEMKISQVIYNLINNAITYTGVDKTVTVSQSIANGRVRIEILDTGNGIAEEQLPYIWDRYYKVDKAHKRAAIGTGLGLSIVKSILTLHGADFGVISSVGQGSIFFFELELIK